MKRNLPDQTHSVVYLKRKIACVHLTHLFLQKCYYLHSPFQPNVSQQGGQVITTAVPQQPAMIRSQATSLPVQV